MFVIKVSSAGHHAGSLAEITINNEPIRIEMNENGHYRGLHIVIINPLNGKVEYSRAFDTYMSSMAFESFIDLGLPPGSIVVAACKDDCATKLSEKVKDWFLEMGS